MTQSYCTVAPHGSVSKPYTHGEHPPPDVHPTKNGINRYWSIATATFYTFQKVPRNKSRRPSSGTRETTSFSTGQLLSRRRTTCPLRKSKKQESNPWEPTIWQGKHQKLTEKRFFWHGPRSIFSIQLQVINFRRVYYRLSSSVNNYSKYYRFFEECIIVFQAPAQFPKNKGVSNTTFHYGKFTLTCYHLGVQCLSFFIHIAGLDDNHRAIATGGLRVGAYAVVTLRDWGRNLRGTVKSNHQVGDEFIPTIVCFNLPLIGNILLILMVNINGYYMVNDG